MIRLILSVLLVFTAVPARSEPLHFAPNHNFDANGHYLPRSAGFNLADVNALTKLRSLPDGVKGLVWVGQCNGVDAIFLQTVQPFLGQPKLFGFYLMDDPDPKSCKPDNLKAEADWIHANAPDAKTFIVLMNLGPSTAPSYLDSYNPTNSHVDLYGIDAYPCRTEVDKCDYAMINRAVAAADDWGIPRRYMVPVYQAFGGGNWKDDGGGRYVLPTTEQMKQIMERWESFISAPVFDYAYSWGVQKADDALEGSPELQDVFTQHNK